MQKAARFLAVALLPIKALLVSVPGFSCRAGKTIIFFPARFLIISVCRVTEVRRRH